jgi:hypothetical protein
VLLACFYFRAWPAALSCALDAEDFACGIDIGQREMIDDGRGGVLWPDGRIVRGANDCQDVLAQ